MLYYLEMEKINDLKQLKIKDYIIIKDRKRFNFIKEILLEIKEFKREFIICQVIGEFGINDNDMDKLKTSFIAFWSEEIGEYHLYFLNKKFGLESRDKDVFKLNEEEIFEINKERILKRL